MKRNVDLTEDRLFTTPPPQQDPDLIFGHPDRSGGSLNQNSQGNLFDVNVEE